MAEAALFPVLRSAFDGLGSLIREEFGLIWGSHKDIAKLSSTLSTILAVLADAEEKQLKDKGVKNWLAKLKYAAFDLDDILDKCTTEASRRKLETQGRRITNELRDFFSGSNPVVFSFCMAHKIKEIRERLEMIAEERSKFHLREGVTVYEIKGREETASFINDSDVYGRDEDKERIVELLLDEGNDGEVSVIPVVAMGGLGKTTVAQLVFNNTRVERHFDLRIWLCVSDDFDLFRTTKAILESATDGKCDFEVLDVLQRHLREKLEGRRFLLVLDDMWGENPHKWEQLRTLLQAGAFGSKIIVTTRSDRVASIMGTLTPYHLGRLSDDDCWTLFKQRAFERGQEENPNFVLLGKEIVKKCGGVPLAAKALGSLMRFKTEQRQWEFIKENEIWNLPEEENAILPALRLSYHQLSSQIKQCFAYCSVFPKDHIIETEELILLWIAEGFIQPTPGSEPMEVIGRDYFNNLLWWSFFQEPKKDDDGIVVRCKMHDLMHDLAVSVSRDVSCSIVKECDMTSIPSECRRLSLGPNSVLSMDLIASNRREKLRTLLQLSYRNTTPSFDISIHLPCLRVLDLRWVSATKEMLNSISRLKQLRYLHLSLEDDVRSLPASFSKLHNLQTLRLRERLGGSYGLEELPRDMRRMTSLRHLLLTHVNRLTHMPAKMGELKYLQTLPVFIVGKQSGCNIRELQDLKLGGGLNIRDLENVRDKENAVEAKLNEKANLRSLAFSWSDGDIDVDMRGRSEDTLEGLQPHPNVKCLTVENYGGQRFPHWMGSMANLKQLSLIKCRGCEQLPPLGQLSLFKSLYIEGMDALKCFASHFYGDKAFPSLEDLTFKDMPNLEEWSSESEHPQPLPRLKKLTLIRCPKLTAIPCFPSLSSLAIEDFDGESLPVDLFQSQSHLSKLTISNCSKLKSLPSELGNLAALQDLRIYSCNSLTSLRLQGRFPSLQSPYIDTCGNLVSMAGDMHHLTSLETLHISWCPKLGSLPEGMEHLTSLKSLSICDCRKVTCLPEGLKHASMLQSLEIFFLRRFTALPEWIGNLSSLQTLTIWFCNMFVSLPSGLQYLTNLKSLSIDCRPELEERCKRETGEDWHKIAHIPSIQINFQFI